MAKRHTPSAGAGWGVTLAALLIAAGAAMGQPDAGRAGGGEADAAAAGQAVPRVAVRPGDEPIAARRRVVPLPEGAVQHAAASADGRGGALWMLDRDRFFQRRDPGGGPAQDAYFGVVIDADTGEVLHRFTRPAGYGESGLARMAFAAHTANGWFGSSGRSRSTRRGASAPPSPPSRRRSERCISP